MKVRTESPALTQSRKTVLELLHAPVRRAAQPPTRRGTNSRSGCSTTTCNCRSRRGAALHVDSDPNPFVWVDLNKCILCTRCVRACAEVQGRFVWGLSDRGFDARIVAGADVTMLEARCESCGACVAYCPTGALDNKMSMDSASPTRK